ncbi:MAG: hypothetical protein KIT84_40525 [Labilithrix sp.]|nr:hypothetical protein [Labilithrix sp.]MCW5817354.1 hypothetical protein [Labilithrix sp.]
MRLARPPVIIPLVVLAFLVAEVDATAQERADVVTLRDGTRIEGVVQRNVPGRFVVIRTLDGMERTLTWEKIDEIDMRAPPSTAPAAATGAGQIKTTTEGQVDASGARFAQTTDCTDAKGDPKCHREVAATANASGVSAQYAAVNDCQTSPNDPKCREETNIGVGTGGIGASFKRETVERVTERPNGAVNFGMDLGGGGLVGGTATVGFLSATMKIKFLVGGKFPGEDGGGWSGLAFEPTLTGLMIFSEQPATEYTSASSEVIGGLQVGATAGWQILYFGKMDKSSLKQGGFGLLLGGFVGATGIAASSDIEFSPSYGPIINLSFPSYNAGTAHYSAFNLTGMVLPTGDAGTLILASLGVFF